MMNPPAENKLKLQWWERRSVQWFAVSTVAVVVLLFFVWWTMFRSYVSTNDARISADIIRIAPVGVSGIIEKVYVREGDKVSSGEVLVEIDHRIPEAQLSKAKARYEQAKTELERAKGLAHKEFTSARELDVAQTNFSIAESELRIADLNLQNTYLKSPINGIVVQKLAHAGNLLEPGQVAISVSDADNAWVSANIEETNIARVKLGQEVFINLDEGGKLGGRVSEILSATASQFSLLPSENASGNFTKVVQKIPIKITLDPHPGKTLRAGQSVTIKIRVQ